MDSKLVSIVQNNTMLKHAYIQLSVKLIGRNERTNKRVSDQKASERAKKRLNERANERKKTDQ